METLIINGISIDDFLSKVKKTVSETMEAGKAAPQKEVKPNYLTRSEVAGRLTISLPTLNEYTKRGLIPAYRFGSRVLYKEEEVENALNQVITSKFRK